MVVSYFYSIKHKFKMNYTIKDVIRYYASFMLIYTMVALTTILVGYHVAGLYIPHELSDLNWWAMVIIQMAITYQIINLDVINRYVGSG